MTYYIYNSLLYIHHNKGQPRFFKSGMADIGYKRLLDGEYITFPLKIKNKNLKKLETEFRNELRKYYPSPYSNEIKDVGEEIHIFNNFK